MRGNLEFVCEHLQHASEVAENFVVPDANDSVANCIKVSIAAPIGCAVGMLPTIDLDDETLLTTQEVHVVRSEGLLARKLQPTETAVAKRQPQDPFGSRASPPQRAGAAG